MTTIKIIDGTYFSYDEEQIKIINIDSRKEISKNTGFLSGGSLDILVEENMLLIAYKKDTKHLAKFCIAVNLTEELSEKLKSLLVEIDSEIENNKPSAPVIERGSMFKEYYYYD